MVLRFQLPYLKPGLVQHFLPLGPHPLCFLLCLPCIVFPQKSQPFVQVARVRNVCAKRCKALVHLLLRLRILLPQRIHLLHLGVLACRAAVPVQSPVKLPGLFSLHAAQALLHLSGTFLAARCCSCHFHVVSLDAFKNSFGVRHFRHVQDITDHLACQLHPGILVFGVVRKLALCHRSDGVVQVHQHIQPFRAFHAGTACHAGLSGSRLPQSPGAVPCPICGPCVVHIAFVQLRRVSIPHAVGLSQGYTMLPCLGHRCTPAAVCLHQFRFRTAVFVHGVRQFVQFRVFVPKFTAALHRTVQHLACQRFGQCLCFFHVRAVCRQVLRQHFCFPGQLCPVHSAAVGLRPAACQPLNGRPAHLHATGQAKELAQSVQRRSLVRNGVAGLPLGVPLCIPVRLFCQLVAEPRKVAFLCQLAGTVIISYFPHYAVSIYPPAVFLACSHPAVRCRDIQRELSACAAKVLRHPPDLFQLLRGRRRVR